MSAKCELNTDKNTYETISWKNNKHWEKHLKKGSYDRNDKPIHTQPVNGIIHIDNIEKIVKINIIKLTKIRNSYKGCEMWNAEDSEK